MYGAGMLYINTLLLTSIDIKIRIGKSKRIIFFERYRDTPSNQRESIAEHQYFVILITKILCDKLKVSKEIKMRALEIAIIHDVPESYSDDFTYDIKYSKGSEEFRKSLEIVENSIAKEISEIINYDNFIERYDEYKDRKTLASKIVKCADWFSVLLFCECSSSVQSTSSLQWFTNCSSPIPFPLILFLSIPFEII